VSPAQPTETVAAVAPVARRSEAAIRATASPF
jgi:hypothetical protein